jgi:hypothetical protein
MIVHFRGGSIAQYLAEYAVEAISDGLRVELYEVSVLLHSSVARRGSYCTGECL